MHMPPSASSSQVTRLQDERVQQMLSEKRRHDITSSQQLPDVMQQDDQSRRSSQQGQHSQSIGNAEHKTLKLELEATELRGKLQQQTWKCEKAEHHLEDAVAELQATQQHCRALESQLSDMKGQCMEQSEQLERLCDRCDASSSEVSALQASRDWAAAQLDTRTAQHEAAQQQLDQLTFQLGAAHREASNAVEQLQELQRQQSSVVSTVCRMHSELRLPAVEEGGHEVESMVEGVERRLGELLAEVHELRSRAIQLQSLLTAPQQPLPTAHQRPGLLQVRCPTLEIVQQFRSIGSGKVPRSSTSTWPGGKVPRTSTSTWPGGKVPRSSTSTWPSAVQGCVVCHAFVTLGVESILLPLLMIVVFFVCQVHPLWLRYA
jgi:chromosome segregation ATPase